MVFELAGIDRIVRRLEVIHEAGAASREYQVAKVLDEKEETLPA